MNHSQVLAISNDCKKKINHVTHAKWYGLFVIHVTLPRRFKAAYALDMINSWPVYYYKIITGYAIVT